MKKKIRWGILGCGCIANKFIKALRFVEEVEITGSASKTAVRAKDFAHKYNIQKFYNNYEDSAHDPNIDVIYIATIHTLHFENAKLCLE